MFANRQIALPQNVAGTAMHETRTDACLSAGDALQAAYDRIAELEALLSSMSASVPPIAAPASAGGTEGELPDLKMLLDRERIQSMMHDFQKLTGAAFAIVDRAGAVLVASGWQDICTKFHRAYPESARHCRQSDLSLAARLHRGEYAAYRCRNMLWDVVTPLYIGAKYAGNIYTGQFFYDDDVVDTAAFERQAAEYGYDREAYLAALARVPRMSRERVKVLMDFLMQFTVFVSEMGGKTARLINTVAISRRVAVALHESRRHFRQLATHAPVPIAIFDGSGRAEAFNDRFVTTFGYTSASLPTLEAWWEKAFPDPSVRRQAALAWSEAMDRQDDGPRAIEQRIVCANGATRVVETACSRIGGRSIAIFTDITERKISEENLQASEERLQNLYSLSPVGIFLCTPEGRYLSANQALADILGYPSPEALITAVASLPLQTFHEPGEWKDIVEALETKGKFVNRLVRRHRKDGTPIWALMNMRAVRAPDQSISHFEGFTLDITERIQAAKALRDSEERLRILINAMPDLVCFKDGQGRWLEANAFTQNLFGLTPKEYLGKTDCDLAEALEPFRDTFFLCDKSDRLAWHSGKMVRCEEAMLALDGRAVVFDIVKVPLFRADGSRRGLVVVGRDITRQKEASAALAQFNRRLESLVADRTRELVRKAVELEAANARLVELDALKSSFVSSVSHEVRTPLTSILGFARLIERDFHRHFFPLGAHRPELAAKGERIVNNLRVIDREGDRLTRLISEFLDLAKIEYGSLRWEETRVSLNPFLNQVADAVRGMFSDRPDVAFLLDIAPHLPDIRIDQDRLQQVLCNLINNAVKFTASGSVTLSAAMRENGMLHIAVSDTGIGIPAEDLERVFEKFHQVGQKNAGVGVSRGTGLGLTICRQIVQHYDGSIWVESEPGRGSTFHVTLPVILDTP